MRKIRLLIILAATILLCGCTATSVIEINETTVKEEITFEGAPKDEEFVKDYFEGIILLSHQKYGSGYNRRFVGEFPINEFKDDSITNTCFEKFIIENDKEHGNYNIEMNNFKCEKELEQSTKYTLKIKANGEIISCNNFTESGGYLIWYYDENNTPNVSCKISYGEGTGEVTTPEPDPNPDTPTEPNPDPDPQKDPDPIKEKEPEPTISKEEALKQTIIVGCLVGGFLIIIFGGMIISAQVSNKNR